MRYDYALRARANESLTTEELRAKLPAIFAEQPHPSRSKWYVHISTADVLGALVKEGFDPVEARVSRTRDEDRRGFAKHMLRLRARADHADRRVGDTSFEVILRNSHDGSGSYEFFAGLFKLLCLNGMVANAGNLEKIRVWHTGQREKQIAQVIDGAYAVVKEAPVVLLAPREWPKIELTVAQRTEFAAGAHALRFADAEGKVTTAIKPSQLLEARRPGDLGHDLWTTFNVVQENVIRGGQTAMGRDAKDRPRRSTSRAINGIDADVKLNKGLWAMAAAVAEAA